MRRLSIFIISILFTVMYIQAAEATVYLDCIIDETPISYELYRKAENNKLTILGENTIYVINNINLLDTNTRIENFTIIANSNLETEKTVTVDILPESFKTILDNNTIFDSQIIPIIDIIFNNPIISAGSHKNIEVYNFNIYITGRKNLPPGIYTCDIDVKYTIK